jgi:hypothetical protein
MRAAIILVLLACACATQEVPLMKKTVLFDFTDPAVARAWRNVDDDVMGGVSSSRIEAGSGSGPVGARFVGTVSLENNGGFASVRSTPARMDLTGSDAIELELVGDGHTYKLSIRLDSDFDGVSYQANLTPPAGVVSRTRIAYADLVPMWRGRRVADAPPFSPARVAQVGLVIGDKQAGAFELGLVAVRALYP